MTIPIFKKRFPPDEGAGRYSRSHPQIRAARGDLGIGVPAHDPSGDELDSDPDRNDIRPPSNARPFSGAGASAKLRPYGGGTKRK